MPKYNAFVKRTTYYLLVIEGDTMYEALKKYNDGFFDEDEGDAMRDEVASDIKEIINLDKTVED